MLRVAAARMRAIPSSHAENRPRNLRPQLQPHLPRGSGSSRVHVATPAALERAGRRSALNNARDVHHRRWSIPSRSPFDNYSFGSSGASWPSRGASLRSEESPRDPRGA